MAETTGQKPVRVGAALGVVAALIATRVIGISALMPVFSPYGLSLTSNALLVGLAFGGYGLTMAIMQLPMGMVSDRIGRRRTIVFGMLLYIGGNIMAWWAPTIELLIVARLIEGVGAVSSVAMALLTDVLPESRRTLGLAVAGIGAGVGFLLGVSLGPLVAGAIGVPGLFLASAVMGGLVLVGVAVVLPADTPTGRATSTTRVWDALRERRALAADFSGFSMNAALTATMFALPLVLVGDATDQLTESGYRRLLLISVLIGGILSMGAARAADKRGKVAATATFSAVLIGLGAAALVVGDWLPLYVVAIVYFGAHGAQSASLPSLIGATVDPARRGAAMGGYNAWAYLGSFVGGIVGSSLYANPPWLPIVLAASGFIAATALVLSLRGRATATPQSPAAPTP